MVSFQCDDESGALWIEREEKGNFKSGHNKVRTLRGENNLMHPINFPLSERIAEDTKKFSVEC